MSAENFEETGAKVKTGLVISGDSKRDIWILIEL